MKNALLILMTVLMAAPALARNDHAGIRLTNTTQASFLVDEPGLAVAVDYPGMQISGVCAIEIVADSYRRGNAMHRLLAELEIQNFFGDSKKHGVELVNDTVLRISLIVNTYVDGVVIVSKDGSTLKQVVERTLGKNRTVIVRPRSC